MTELNLEACRRIVQAALAKGVAIGCAPMSAAVLDAGGNVIAFERADDTPPGRFEVARAKAYGAVMLHKGGRAQEALAEARPQVATALGGAFDGKFFPLKGGVLVRNAAGRVLGAVGVTGDSPDNDEACAVAGVEAVEGLVAEP
ncbi:GlcG/HbpS family heme-binding protein [Tropicimonas sediminicola]|uniref:Uncharacterized conserved protein GlcG, DUF336 family n=1 Tax=Tropicimonas sediminicola TaxID=1031541 RepID=A0A239GWP3_9RHOB|nr:heme-binding protein [Tropicimonas sediminicola]SNS72943.1 Uncharacterized conserved protein GlcG, DUF336 family [Tropicimonas sediminicola]